MSRSEKDTRLYYGWIMVGVCFFIGMTLLGIRFSFGVFFKSLAREFGLNRAVTSSIFSAYMIFSAVFTVGCGWALDRFGPRITLTAMGLITGFSLLLVSRTTALWQMFASYSLLLAIGTGGTYIVLMSAVSRWFDKRRGVAMGIAGSGGPLGIILMAPLATHLIGSLGWRGAYAAIGLAAGVFVVVLSTRLKKDPRYLGFLPDGIPIHHGKSHVQKAEEDTAPRDLTLRDAFRFKNYWLMLLSWLLLAFSTNLMLTHLVPHMTDVGISAGQAATVLSMAGFFNIVSRLIVGSAADRLGRAAPGVACALGQAGIVLCFIWARELWLAYLCSILFGFCWGGVGIVTTALIADHFRGRAIGTIMGTIDIAFGLGAALGPAIGGHIYDVTGSYTFAFIIVAVVMLGEALVIYTVDEQDQH